MLVGLAARTPQQLARRGAGGPAVREPGARDAGGWRRGEDAELWRRAERELALPEAGVVCVHAIAEQAGEDRRRHAAGLVDPDRDARVRRSRRALEQAEDRARARAGKSGRLVVRGDVAV